MSIQDSINKWGIEKINDPYWGPLEGDARVPDTAIITLDEQIPSPYYCETCGPDPYTINIIAKDEAGAVLGQTSVYMTMGEVIEELMAGDG